MKALALLLTSAALLTLPATGTAQQGGDRCDLDRSLPAPVRIVEEAGASLVYVDGRFLVRCDSGSLLQGDRALIRQATRDIEITGNVFYSDAQRTLISERATYTSSTGRLFATGNVVFTDIARGSTLRGPELEYLRPLQGRPEAQIVATQRPHLTLVPAQEARGRREPLEVDADRITGTGQDRFAAAGRVVIRRSDLDASAEQALYTAAPERLELVGAARIRSDKTILSGNRVEADLVAGTVQRVQSRGNARVEGERFTLSGAEIDAALPGSSIDRVDARGDAALFEPRMRVEGSEIRLFFRADSLQRVVAKRSPGAERPVVTANGFRMEGDSLDADLPSQRLERVVAIGSARGEAYDTLPDGSRAGPVPDGSPASLVSYDWIEGDTLTGFFAPAAAGAPRDAGEDVELRRALAQGTARSLYRVREERETASPGERPSINYVAGDTIDLAFAEGEVDEARVQGLKRGVYLQPGNANAAPPPGPRPPSGPGGSGR
jgi:lipopolysaccharide export system protein LptA